MGGCRTLREALYRLNVETIKHSYTDELGYIPCFRYDGTHMQCNLVRSY
jgi:hypothetical protein